MEQTCAPPSAMVNLDRPRAIRWLCIGLALLLLGAMAIAIGVIRRPAVRHLSEPALLQAGCVSHPGPNEDKKKAFSDAALLLGAVALTAALTVLIVASLVHARSRRIQHIINGYAAGDYLAHWVCSPAECETFLAGERKRPIKRIWMALGMIGIFAVMLLFNSPDDDFGQMFFWGLWLMGLAGWAAAFAANVWLRRERMRRLKEHGADVYIGVDSAYCSGDMILWTGRDTPENGPGSNRRLIDMLWVPGSPPVLQFTTQYGLEGAGSPEDAERVSQETENLLRGSKGRGAAMRGAYVLWDQTLRVPVAVGMEEHVRKAATVLRGEAEPWRATPRPAAPIQSPAPGPADAPALPLINLDWGRAARRLGIGVALALIGVICFAMEVRHPHRTLDKFVQILPIACGILSSMASLGMLILALLAYERGRRKQRIIDGYLAGDYLAHWVCSKEEWEAYLSREWQRSNASPAYAWLSVFFVLATLISIGAFKDGDIPGGLGVLAGSFALMTTIWGLVMAGRRLGWIVRHRRLRKLGGNVYIGRDSAYCSGDMIFWMGKKTPDRMLGANRRLIRMLWRPGRPDVIELTAEYGHLPRPRPTALAQTAGSMLEMVDLLTMGQVLGGDAVGLTAPGYNRSRRRIVWDTTLRLPVPGGFQQEAHKVAVALREEVFDD